MTVRATNVLLVIALAAGCDDSGGRPSVADAGSIADAGEPDAAPDAAAPVGCEPGCTPAARCVESDCQCPTGFVDPAGDVLATQMIPTAAGFVSGVAGVAGADARNHALTVTAAQDAALGVPLLVNGSVFVGLGYDVIDATTVRGTYLATAGTVTLLRRCAAGIAGTVTGATLVEIDPLTFQPLPGGCTTALAAMTFDVGGTCP